MDTSYVREGGVVKLMWFQKIVSMRQFISGVSHATGVKIVQESGRIIKRATQIVIKSGPRVIIRAWEMKSKRRAFEKCLADQQGTSPL